MKVYLEVYGCTANKGDASLALGLLKENNHETVDNIDDAEVLILLTCTVIGTTEQRMLSRLRSFNKMGKHIIVAGCMAPIQSDLIKSIAPDAELLPPQYTHHIVDLVEGKSVSFTNKNKTCFPKYFGETTAPISISEGCLFSCSYCITSLARGKLISYPVDQIVGDVCSAIKQGCKEIQLTAQDTGSYGLDTGHNLGELLEHVCQVDEEYRIRTGMMNPRTLLKHINEIIQAYGNSKIYKFLHLPIQSGDNDILQKMNRKYTVNDCMEIINQFRDIYPEIVIATDIIAGFPTETDEQFQHTVDLLKSVKPDITNITRYSARPHTKAKTMKGRIKTEIAKKRSKMLTELCSNLSMENNLNHVGKKYTVLITEKGKNNTVVGRAENYKPVVIQEQVDIGEFVQVTIENAAPTYLVGRLI